jgi:hypothetical protein
MTFAIPRAVAEEVLPSVRDLHGLVLDAARAQPLMDHVRALAPHRAAEKAYARCLVAGRNASN